MLKVPWFRQSAYGVSSLAVRSPACASRIDKSNAACARSRDRPSCRSAWWCSSNSARCTTTPAGSLIQMATTAVARALAAVAGELEASGSRTPRARLAITFRAVHWMQHILRSIAKHADVAAKAIEPAKVSSTCRQPRLAEKDHGRRIGQRGGVSAFVAIALAAGGGAAPTLLKARAYR